jgi:hypothetical protein
MASLDSIIAGYVEPDMRQAIRKMAGDHPVSLLHEKFWGRSMEEEEETWHAQNAEMLDVHLADCEDSVEGELSEYRRGCYALSFGENLLLPRVTKIWVRTEYILLDDAIEEHFAKTVLSPQCGAVVLTGQPGTGEKLLSIPTLAPS